MSVIDKQCIASVRTLERLGFTLTLSGGWAAPLGDALVQPLPVAEVDAMHALLVLRADGLGRLRRALE